MNSGNIVVAPLSKRQHPLYGVIDAPITRKLFGEVLASRRCEPVIARAAVLKRLAPLAVQPSFQKQSLQRGVKRPLFDAKNIRGDLLDRLSDLETMELCGSFEDTQDQHVEGAGRDFVSHSHDIASLCACTR